MSETKQIFKRVTDKLKICFWLYLRWQLLLKSLSTTEDSATENKIDLQPPDSNSDRQSTTSEALPLVPPTVSTFGILAWIRKCIHQVQAAFTPSCSSPSKGYTRHVPIFIASMTRFVNVKIIFVRIRTKRPFFHISVLWRRIPSESLVPLYFAVVLSFSVFLFLSSSLSIFKSFFVLF